MDRRQVIVGSMHERKVEMAKRSCAFVGLPGGFGTFEEVLEAITWTHIGIHDKRELLYRYLCPLSNMHGQLSFLSMSSASGNRYERSSKGRSHRASSARIANHWSFSSMVRRTIHSTPTSIGVPKS